jgi:hypothetical protein
MQIHDTKLHDLKARVSFEIKSLAMIFSGDFSYFKIEEYEIQLIWHIFRRAVHAVINDAVMWLIQ